MLTPKQRKQATFKHHIHMSVGWCLTEPTAELKLFLSDMKSQEQMRGAQIYKRLIVACNPIALLAQV